MSPCGSSGPGITPTIILFSCRNAFCLNSLLQYRSLLQNVVCDQKAKTSQCLNEEQNYMVSKKMAGLHKIKIFPDLPIINITKYTILRSTLFP